MSFLLTEVNQFAQITDEIWQKILTSFMTEVTIIKKPVQWFAEKHFSIFPSYRLISSYRLSTRISIFPPIDWPLKFDYSSLLQYTLWRQVLRETQYLNKILGNFWPKPTNIHIIGHIQEQHAVNTPLHLLDIFSKAIFQNVLK